MRDFKEDRSFFNRSKKHKSPCGRWGFL